MNFVYVFYQLCFFLLITVMFLKVSAASTSGVCGACICVCVCGTIEYQKFFVLFISFSHFFPFFFCSGRLWHFVVFVLLCVGFCLLLLHMISFGARVGLLGSMLVFVALVRFYGGISGGVRPVSGGPISKKF